MVQYIKIEITHPLTYHYTLGDYNHAKPEKIKPVDLLDAVMRIIDKYPIDINESESANPIVTVKSFEKMKPEIIISESYSYN